MTMKESGEIGCNLEPFGRAPLCSTRKDEPPGVIRFRIRREEEVLSLARRHTVGTYPPDDGVAL